MFGRMKKAAAAAGAALVAGLATVPAQAAILATDVQPIVDEVTGDAAVIFPIVLGGLAIMLGYTIGLKLIKRFTRAL